MNNDEDTFAAANELAIVGMTCRFPGASNLEQFWRNLRDGVESISFFTDEELKAEGIGPDVLSNPNYVKAKGLLKDAEWFDAAFFGFNPREAQITDPQHRLFLECAWEVLENAGYVSQTYKGRIGVYAGVGMNTYLFNLFTNRAAVGAVNGFQVMIGNDKDYLTTRVSYKLNLKGPSINLQTSCSTSLVAVSMASQSLLNGECDMALAGGVSIKVPQKSGYFYQPEGISSQDGHCRAFDARAQGHAGGNGVGIVLLKRLSDALADGDYIHAIIKGCAVNNDGSLKIGYTAPSVAGQADVIAEALAMAGIEARTVSYVEAHGTATALGDTVEIEALTQAFRHSTEQKNFCAVGSVKTNIGHTDSAAGVAGLIKTVLALQHRQLPPSLFYEEPNPRIDFANSPFYVNDRLREWKNGDAPLRAGVSSFGIGGTNAHVIVEEAPPREVSGTNRPHHLLLLSAFTPTALEAATANLIRYLEQHPDANMADVAYTLQVGRKTFAHRRMLVCSDLQDALAALKASDPKRVLTARQESEESTVAFMFPGQGTQYVNMAAELYQGEPAFREHVDRCSELLLADIGQDLREVLYPQEAQREEAARQLEQTRLTQPALFVIESALVRLLAEWGVRAQAMIGHSIGEYVAAQEAGVFSLEEGLKLVAARGRLIQTLPAGAMLLVMLPEKKVKPLLDDQLTLAAVNGPSLTVVSGPTTAVHELEKRLGEQGINSRRLHTSHAFHSKMMDPVLGPFTQQMRSIKLKSPRLPFISNLTGTWITETEATDADYWARHLRHTVRFADGLREMLQDPERVLLEIGPGRSLQTLARQHLEKSEGQLVFSTLRGPKDAQPEHFSLLHTLGQLWLAGVPVNWTGFHARERRLRLPLPAYPFERQRYWIEAAVDVVQAPATEHDDSKELPLEADTVPHKAMTHTVMKQAETRTAGSEIAAAPEETRRERILRGLRVIFHDLTGIDAAQIDIQASFFELGADSLLLIQAAQAIQDRLGVKISLRQLFEELSTLHALSIYLDAQLPPEALASRPLEPEHVATGNPVDPESPVDLKPQQQSSLTKPAARQASAGNNADDEAAADSVLERIMARQLQVMSEQLDLLRQGTLAPEGSAVTGIRKTPQPGQEPALQMRPEKASIAAQPWEPVTGEASAPDGPQKIAPEPFVPFQPLEVRPESNLTPQQQKHLEGLIARFNRRTQTSKRLTQKYRPFLADPRVAVGFRLSWKELIYPIISQRSNGSKLWDVDGNEYVDFTMGFGVHLFGHSPQFITDALADRLRQGVHLGPQSYLAGEVAETICRLTGVERVTFCNSGTEAVMTALRLARAVTRRRKIALFTGSYHGSFDGVLARARNLNGKLEAIPMAPGVLPHMIEDVLVLNYDSPGALDLLRAHASELAAVLVEPVQSRRPDLQPKEFLHELRSLTEEAGVALIFDEVITGFRIHPGGAQAWFDVQADLVIYGKVIGGGMPIGVVAGKAAYMDAVDGGMWSFGDNSYPQAQQTFFAGTFCKHPFAMAAASAVLQHMHNSGPALQQELNERTERLGFTLNAYFEEQGLPLRLVNFGSVFRFTWPRELRLMDLLSIHLVEKGVYVWEGGTRFLSTAHSEEDIEYFIGAVKESVAEMQEGGCLPSSAPGPAKGGGRSARGASEETNRPPLSQDVTAARPASSSGPVVENSTDSTLSIALTEGQKQIWIMSQMGEDASSAYNESVTLHLRGEFDIDAMRRALQRVVERHEALRATFSPEGDYQSIAGQMKVEIPLFDFSNLDRDRRETELAKWVTGQTRQSFDLARGPLLRVSVARSEEQYHLLVMTIHHIITDGWSNGIVLQDLRELYAAECQGIDSQLPPPAQYSEYAQRQAQQQQSQKMLEDEAYWLDQFSGSIPVMDLPTDRPRSRGQAYVGDTQRLNFDPVLYRELKRLSAQQGSTLYLTLLAGFKMLLYHLTGQGNLVVGISAAGQQTAGGENLVGYCVNVLPLRSRVLEDEKFTGFLHAVKHVLLGAYDHQDYSFGHLIRGLNLRREPGRSPLISAYFNMDRPGGSRIDFYRLEGSVQTNFSGCARWDLTWNITESKGELLLDSIYKTDLFDGQTIRRWMELYQTLLRQVTERPELSPGALSKMLDEAERQQLIDKSKEFEKSDIQLLRNIKLKRSGKSQIVN
jgi:acyl transferase domain-containing protein